MIFWGVCLHSAGRLTLSSLTAGSPNISLLSSAEESGTNIQMHLENNAFIYPSKLSGAKMWVTQTLDLHPMSLNFKCAL